ncbi:hypothetical protein [Actinoplanes sp. L3-i22]|uniref:hypothetical protein n=1 Tax=Actinoplanes sp. L3-i22 TaxID=2836373 RepID=UPI001C743608|nr:hypothetical protein [Actinoplanes sp. L3-i22]BCY08754.1 hypothetical protein L3i22_038420 [Actinoplanes sp. L3-i22]
MRDLEDDLTRTFRAAGVAAPDSGPGFSAALSARRRRRTRTRTATMVGAFAAVVAVAAGVAVFAAPVARQPDLAQSLDPAPLPTGSLPTVALSAAKPFRDLWPDALVELPLRLPGGRRYSVVAPLDGDEYLVAPRDDLTRPLPVVLNARTGAARKLGTVPSSGYAAYDQAGTYLTEHYIVWVVAAQQKGGAMYHEVWSAPRDGGTAVRRARFGPGDMTVSVAEAGGVFYASTEPAAGGGAVYRIPDGGEPQKVAGSEGYVLRYGSWAVRNPVRSTEDSAPAAVEAPRFWNVATGERRTPRTLTGVTLIDCNPSICVGRAAGSLVSYGIDGSRPLRTSGDAVDPTGADTCGSCLPGINVFYDDSYGRFLQLRLKSGVYLWDRNTNTLGTQQDGSSGDGDVIDVGQPGGKQHLLLLSRIR